MATRHARRIYAGGIPPRATEDEIFQYFTEVLKRALAGEKIEGPPVLKVYLNTEKCYAFVELPTIELCTACMSLDGIRFNHPTGSTIVRVRRPNDYRPELLTGKQGPLPRLNIQAVQNGVDIFGADTSNDPYNMLPPMTGPFVSGGIPRIFVGGLPSNLQDDQIVELLGAFGTVKSFHQVRDPMTQQAKGYAFCEYEDVATADMAIQGLNGMPLGDKVLNVRSANAPGVPASGPATSAPPLAPAQPRDPYSAPSRDFGAPAISSPTRVRIAVFYVLTMHRC